MFVEQIVHVQRQFGARIEAVTRHDVGDGVGFLAAVVGGAGFGGGVGDAERGRVGVGFALPAHACADGPAAGGFGGKVVGSEEFEAAFGYAVGVQAAAVLVAGFALAVTCLYLPFGRDAAADFDFPAVGFGLVGGAVVGVAARVASCCGGEVVFTGAVHGGGCVQTAFKPFAFDAGFQIVAGYGFQVAAVFVFLRLRDEQAAVRAVKRQVAGQVEHDACVGGETVGGHIGHALCAAVVAAGAVTAVSAAEYQRKVVGGAETGGEIAADLPPGAVLRDGLGKR
ncbi:Uncharacterised protein [Neisseria meningitidis]|nr:Uncharacterised protein [Neisseria meningitidis]CWQ75296.1 Uncharacterised protein [Neisseria meningitidis]